MTSLDGSSYLDLSAAGIFNDETKPVTICYYSKPVAAPTYAGVLRIAPLAAANEFIILRGASGTGYEFVVGSTAGGSPPNMVVPARVDGIAERVVVSAINGMQSSSPGAYVVWINRVKYASSATVSYTAQPTNGTTYLGWDGPDSKWGGLLDELTIFNGAFTDADAARYFDDPWQGITDAKPRIFAVSVAGSVSVAPSTGAVTITGPAPTIGQPQTVAPSTGAVAFTGFAPSVVQAQNIGPSTGAIAFSGFSPSIAQPQSVAPGVGAITFTGFAPSVTQIQGISPAAVAVLISGFAPAISQPQTVAPAAGAFAVTGFAPSIGQPQAYTASPGVFTFTGFAPLVAQAQTVSPATSIVAFTGFAPVVTQPQLGAIAVAPDVGLITVTGFAPIVFQSQVNAMGGGGYAFRPPKRVPKHKVELEEETLAEVAQAPIEPLAVVLPKKRKRITMFDLSPAQKANRDNVEVEAEGIKASAVRRARKQRSHNEMMLLF